MRRSRPISFLRRGLIPALFASVLAACNGPAGDAQESVETRAGVTQDGAPTSQPSSDSAQETAAAMTKSPSGYDLTPIQRTDAEWRELLTAEEFNIARQEGTEYAGTGRYLDNKQTGVYLCIGCGLPLYKSTTKYESGSGWPSFWEPYDPTHVREVQDSSAGMVRTEIECVRCGSHLGHVFNDGPQPTGMRHCTNGTALRFVAEGEPMPEDGKALGGGEAGGK